MQVRLRILARTAIISAIQILYFLVLYELGNRLAIYFRQVSSHGVGWGITIYYFTHLFIGVVILGNLLSLFRVSRWMILTISILILIAFLFQTFPSFPYRALFVLVISSSALCLLPLSERIFKPKKLKIRGTRSAIFVDYDHRTVKIEGELTTTPAFYAIKNSIQNWEAPYQEIAVTEAEKLDIIAKVEAQNNPEFKVYFE